MPAYQPKTAVSRTGWIIGLVAALTMATLVAVGWIKIQQTASDQEAADRKIALLTKERDQLAKKPSHKLPPPAPPAPVIVTVPVEPSFKEDWEKAIAILEEEEKAEPAKTAKRLRLLTAGELAEANSSMPVYERYPLLLCEGASSLRSLGLSDWLHVRSARVAKGSGDFRRVAKAFWTPEMGPSGLANMAGEWLLIIGWVRSTIVESVTSDTKPLMMHPQTRDAILHLGGQKWLSR